MAIEKQNNSSLWYLWLLPIIALAFVVFYMKKYTEDKGQEISVFIPDASSVKPEKTNVLYRGVPIGVVKEITLSPDGKAAQCHIALHKTASHFAVQGSKFYLVTPKVGIDEISGLDTLLSGSYFIASPGERGSDKQTEFYASTENFLHQSIDNTTSYFVSTNHAESISKGDSIFYRGIIIGAVSDVALNRKGDLVLIKIGIENQFVRLIRTNTIFWKKQAMKADLGLFGSKIKINSIDTILKGGLEIATPPEAGPLALAGTQFVLLDEEPEDTETKKWTPTLHFPKRPKKSHAPKATINQASVNLMVN